MCPVEGTGQVFEALAGMGIVAHDFGGAVVAVGVYLWE